ncbi:MAG: aspartate carbamoyltransferase regulatory subunit [Bacteroidaceae bacterium]|nr:aspartate carbamoyltransferase regulatory subunit [Bacteroidaceae bacterium]MBR0433588.1 aspartate carbamoyltransferase regulatory subunit [Bacteroidaceae bacterium]
MENNPNPSKVSAPALIGRAGGESGRQLIVSALDHGTVIDHIPCDRLFEVINLLHLQEMTSKVTIGFNLKSSKMGTKSIIKIADRFFTDEELNQLSIVAPNVSLSIIRDYEVVEKKQVCLPDDLRGLVRCNNPKCITNNEPMPTLFHVADRQRAIIRCHYCNHEQNINDVKLV